MSFILGTVILPNPKKYTHNFIETVAENDRIFGKTTRKYQSRKRQHVLEYLFLTQAQVGSILSLYTPGNVVLFQITEPNLQYGPIEVLVEITNRNFPPSGELWLEDLTIGLTEVG